MSDKVQSSFITDYIKSRPTLVIEFVWQGGEPTPLGIDFFERVIALQRSFASGKTITNSCQTNGTLLNDEWCDFLRKNHFMVGISYPEYKLGNVCTDGLLKMVAKSVPTGFGVTKGTALPNMCKECDVLVACRGGCPKHCFAMTYDGQPGFQYPGAV